VESGKWRTESGKLKIYPRTSGYHDISKQKCLVMVEDIIEQGQLADSVRSVMMEACKPITNSLPSARIAQQFARAENTPLELHAAINVSPNPVSESMILEMRDFSNTRIDIKIVDLTGRTILATFVEAIEKRHSLETLTIELEGLPPGVYLVLVKNNDGLFTNRIIKN
jgi:hypothetical protein